MPVQETLLGAVLHMPPVAKPWLENGCLFAPSLYRFRAVQDAHRDYDAVVW